MGVRRLGALVAVLAAASSCTTTSPSGGAGASPTPSPTAAALPTPSPVESREPVEVGTPIDVASLTGRIVLSSEDDLFTANADGTGLARVTHRRGPEFDPAWSPDGERIVYRDSRRGINHDDEIYVVRADGAGATDLTRDPANDWGPDWSPDGRTIVFNSDRDGVMGGFLVDPDGSHLRKIRTDAYVEYPAWSPDGTRIAFMGGMTGASEYDIWVVDVNGSHLVQLTDSPGPDGWPAWSPDGRRIAFTSVRDDCAYSGHAPGCRSTGDIGPHHDVWVVNADGTGLHRVTSEFGQFVTWSPDGEVLLVSGYDLYVIRPDGTGRASVDLDGFRGGLFPDWVA